MKKWFVLAAALVIIAAIPAAYAASPDREKSNTAQAPSADNKAAKSCKAERQSMGVEAFQKKYGTNHNLHNAFGKCVSGKSKDDTDEKADKGEQGEKVSAAAKACKTERAAGTEAFAKKYGTNHNSKNAFGKCVSSKSKTKDKRDKDD